MAERTSVSGSEGNLGLAILLGCLAPTVLWSLLLMWVTKSWYPEALPLHALLAISVASAGVVFVGLPVHLILQAKSWSGYRHYIATGIISGVTLSLLGSHTLEPGDYGLNFYILSFFTTASAIGMRLGWGKP